MPAQAWLKGRKRWFAVLILLCCLAAGIVTSQWVRKSGFPERLGEEIVRMEKDALPVDRQSSACKDSLACVYGGDNVQAIITGDSHALP